MKPFLNKVLLFLLPILVFGVVTEFFLRSMPNDYKLKADILDKRAADLEVLCLGSSHSYYGINPAYFNCKAFNASYVSQSLYYDLEIFRKYEQRFNKLKFVIVPVSYFSFSEENMASEEGWRVKNYSIYYDMYTANDLSYYSEVLSYPLKINVGRLYSFFYKHESPVTTSNLGFGISYRSERSKDLEVTGEKAALRHKDKKIASNSVNEKSLQELISICNKKNIKVILFTPPAYITYKKHLDNKQLNEVLSVAQSLKKKNKNVFYYNILNDRSFVAKDFYDADHLNDIGAQKLTKKLDTIIENLANKI